MCFIPQDRRKRRLGTHLQPSPFTLVMMAANESTHASVTKAENDSPTSPENSGINVAELSSIVEPATPADVIVQRQIREVILLQNAAVARLHESVSSRKSVLLICQASTMIFFVAIGEKKGKNN